ncbi:MAG: response regulator [Candidatus Brocadiaceae bacterium]|nr:response regulator [Candidatus Brocadiaceae bacterium]
MARVPFHKEVNKEIVSSGLDKEKTPNKLRILVVDDNESVGGILYEYLTRCGYSVKVVDNGAEAIELSTTEDFDLVLTDLIMPDVTGCDVIKALNGFDKRPKIGLVTGWSEKFKPVEGDGLSVNFIVRKPFNLLELAKKINDIFEVVQR